VAVGCFPTVLRAPGATFVTLETQGELRGCIGSLEPRRPLVEDVAENAFAAAFRDPRFPPLGTAEWPEVTFHISYLTPSEPLPADTREELLDALRPGVDGLVLEDPPFRSTFLPQVWESLPLPEEFLGELLRKAGLPRDHWSSTIRFWRYQVTEF
jgi:AmmeMemoRadiSam system protein A